MQLDTQLAHDDAPTNALRLMTVGEAARILKVSRARTYELLRRNVIPGVRLGRQVRVSVSGLNSFIASGGIGLDSLE